MLTREEVQRDLLQKFDDLCKKANVKYVLHGHAAFLAYYGEPINQMNSFEVLMCQGDAEKVSSILDDDAYYFEDSRSNPKLFSPHMIFGFKNSLDIKNKDLNFHKKRNIENHCIRITIHFIERPKNRISYKFLDVNNKVLKFRYMENDYDYKNYKSKRKHLNNLFKLIGDGFYNKRVYNFKRKNLSIDTWDDIGKHPLIQIKNKTPISSEMFKSIESVVFDGVSSYIIKDFESYAAYFYGQNWMNKKWPSVSGYTSVIISWDEYSKDPEVKKTMVGISNRYDIIYQKYRDTLEERRVVKNMKKHIVQSKNIIYLREELISNKEEIIELYEKEDFKELEIILEPLIKSLNRGIKLGYTYSIDDDIDAIVDSFLRKTNNAELADEIKNYRTEV